MTDMTGTPEQPGQLGQLVRQERRRQFPRLLLAGGCAATVAAASVVLLGLSGWFITGAALAGAGGMAAAAAFNVLLPSACIRLLAILRTLGRYGERVAGHDVALHALVRLRPALFAGLLSSPPARALAMTTGEASARLVQDVDEIETRFVRRSSVWAAVAACAAGMVLLLLAGPVAAGCVMAVMAGLIAVAWGLARNATAHGRIVPAENGALKQVFAAMAAAAPELRAYGLENWAADQIAAQSARLVEAQRRATAAGGWFELLQAGATGLAAMLVLATATGSLPVVALAALAAAMTVEGVTAWPRGWQREGRLRAAETRLDAMLAPTPAAPAGYPLAARPPLGFSGIGFSGNGSGTGIHLRPGMIAAVTGRSGCGKTTLLEQLVGLREPRHGQVRLDGWDLAELAPDQRRPCFALAPQDAAVLAGTVRENLALGNPAANEAEMWLALHDAALDARVRALPGGLDNWVGENGSRHSGGERQRLSLARAYLREAPWLLLDEPTEGLDACTEAVVTARLRARLARRRQGALVVTHRAALLAICDTVIAWPAHGPNGAEAALPRGATDRSA